nr:HAMP domain-containing sensor histidine kinase [Methylobacterium dankookense]
MTGRSLRLRIGLAAAALVALALGLAGIGLVVIFDRVSDARTVEDLDRMAKFLAGQVAVAQDGTLSVASEPPDPRLTTPYGGLYWQVDKVGTASLRSRSLWDRTLDVPVPVAGAGPAEARELTGPDGGRLAAVVRRVQLVHGRTEVPATVTVALDRRALAGSRASYLGLLVPSLLALFTVLAGAMFLFVRRALAPLRVLREDLRAVHDGRRTTLPRHFPEEVQPLVDDLNRLILFQERALMRARMQAGDMAHGLKTPLAVLGALARRVADERPDLSGEIEEQALAMGRQVERSLARARVAAAGDLRRRSCPVAPVVARLVSALRRLPGAEDVHWDVSVPPTVAYPGDEGALTELLGNLLDNARKWARRRVMVGTSGNGIVIEDDGPGMSEEAMAGVGRGRRWDETKPGTGFGIAISSDIAEETGGALTLSRSVLGGLMVVVAWDVPQPREP